MTACTSGTTRLRAAACRELWAVHGLGSAGGACREPGAVRHGPGAARGCWLAVFRVRCGAPGPGRPSVRQCTHAPSRWPAGHVGRPPSARVLIGPCRWGRTPCRADLHLYQVGTRSTGTASMSTARRVSSSATSPGSSEAPTRLLKFVVHDPHRRPFGRTSVAGLSASTARLSPTLQLSEVVAVAAPSWRGDRRRDGPRRHAGSCRVVFAADAIHTKRGERSKLMVR